MSRNIVKILEKNFSDLKAGQKMLISSPEKIAEYIKKIPEGRQKTAKEMGIKKRTKAIQILRATRHLIKRY